MPSNPFIPITRKAELTSQVSQGAQTNRYTTNTHSTSSSDILAADKPSALAPSKGSSATQLAALKNLISLQKAEDQRWTTKAIPSAFDEEPERLDRRSDLSTKQLAKELGRSEKAGLGFENAMEDDSTFPQIGTKEALLKQPRKEQQQLRREVLGSRKARSLENQRFKPLANGNRSTLKESDEDDEEVGRSEAVGKGSKAKRRRKDYAIAQEASASTDGSKIGENKPHSKDTVEGHDKTLAEDHGHHVGANQTTAVLHADKHATYPQQVRHRKTSYLDQILAERSEKKNKKRKKMESDRERG